MDLFNKCHDFYRGPEFAQHLGYPINPRMAEALGLNPYFIPVDHSEGTSVFIDGQELIMLGSNNYLGLTSHPHVKEAAVAAVREHGTSCTGSRLLNGTLQLHLDLEERLARFVGKEKALVFSTGYVTNLGVLTALAGKEDVFFCDKEVHASIIDGVSLAQRQQGATVRFFKHNHMQALEHTLAQYPTDQGKLVVVDGVFSMGGDIAPLPDLVRLCKTYQARLLVDDAHALGVLGQGRGTAAHFDCVDEVDVIIGTFSKSLASMGGFVAARKDVIHWIQHRARPFMFSAGLVPANVAAALAALDVIEQEPERVERVNRIAGMMRGELRAMGYDIGASETPVVPLVIGDQFKTMQAWRALFDAGIYTNVALPPAVPLHRSLLRTSYMATHTDEQLDRALTSFRAIRKKLELGCGQPGNGDER